MHAIQKNIHTVLFKKTRIMHIKWLNKKNVKNTASKVTVDSHPTTISKKLLLELD